MSVLEPHCDSRLDTYQVNAHTVAAFCLVFANLRCCTIAAGEAVRVPNINTTVVCCARQIFSIIAERDGPDLASFYII